MAFSTEELTGGITKVVLDGRLDIEGAAAVDLRMNVIAGSKKAVLVDLQQVSFLGSMVLQFPIGTGICVISGFVCFIPAACRAVIASIAVILPVRNAAKAVAGLGIIKSTILFIYGSWFCGYRSSCPQ